MNEWFLNIKFAQQSKSHKPNLCKHGQLEHSLLVSTNCIILFWTYLCFQICNEFGGFSSVLVCTGRHFKWTNMTVYTMIWWYTFWSEYDSCSQWFNPCGLSVFMFIKIYVHESTDLTIWMDDLLAITNLENDTFDQSIHWWCECLCRALKIPQDYSAFAENCK